MIRLASNSCLGPVEPLLEPPQKIHGAEILNKIMIEKRISYKEDNGRKNVKVGELIAKKPLPKDWELKNQQKMATVYKWHKQASKNTRLTPVVVCKMNTRDPLVILDLDHFMSLIR